MILKNKKGFTPIAVVEIDEWEAIRKYCDSRDVMCGGDYDCPYGGAINIWMQKDWIDPAGELHGSFYPDFSESSIGLALYSEWPKVGTTKIRNPLSMGFFDS